MDITYHIKVLLSDYDCVIIPDFGAFIAEYSSPVVDEEHASIPSKDLLFNRQIRRNDGLLINAIIEHHNIDYQKAKKEIAAFVAEVKKRLDKGEHYVFEGLGTMSLDENGFIQFIADEHNSCLLDAYGLRPVHLKKINKKKPTAQGLTQEEEVQSTKRRRLLIPLTAAAAVVLLLIIFSPPLIDMGKVDKAGWSFDTAPPSLTQEQGNLPIVDKEPPSLPLSRKQPVAEAARQAEKEDSLSQDSLKQSVEVPTQKAENAYHIIVASLPNQATADEFLKTFRKQYHFEHLETLTGNGRYRISVAHFAAQSEAVTFVKTLRTRHPQLKDAWVLASRE